MNSNRNLSSIVLLAILLCSLTSKSTVLGIDSIFSVDVPGELGMNETTLKEVQVKSFHGVINSEHFIAVRAENIILDKGLLVEDEDALARFYFSQITFSQEIMKGLQFEFVDTSMIKIQGFVAMKATYIDEVSKNKSAESICLQLNGIVYTLTYVNKVDFVEEYKNLFFDSIVLLNPEKSTQFIVKNDSKIFGPILKLIVTVLILVSILYIKRKGWLQKKSL
jgi:hypothetical protein